MPTAAIAMAAFVGLGLPVLPLLKPLELGDTAVFVDAGRLKPGQAFATDPSGFIVTGWDGPTGEFSHGSIYALKIGHWMYRVDVVTEPLVRVRKKLPATIPGLIGALNSQEPFLHNAAAQELTRRGLIVQSSSAGFVVVSASPSVATETKAVE
jgi:hypothetical protein